MMSVRRWAGGIAGYSVREVLAAALSEVYSENIDMEIPLKVAELDHVVLRCRDQDRAYDFYTRIRGLSGRGGMGRTGRTRWARGRGLTIWFRPAVPRSRRHSTSITCASG